MPASYYFFYTLLVCCMVIRIAEGLVRRRVAEVTEFAGVAGGVSRWLRAVEIRGKVVWGEWRVAKQRRGALSVETERQKRIRGAHFVVGERSRGPGG